MIWCFPHVRGANLRAFLMMLRHCGSSPRAWGKWTAEPCTAPPDTVHPHVRGANKDTKAGATPRFGSSPHAWGKCQQGINTNVSDGGSSPRAWGKWMVFNSGCIMSSGSSPRAWGQCRTSRRNTSQSPVHPHVRGANTVGVQQA